MFHRPGDNRGGKRVGAGRPRLHESERTIAFRITLSAEQAAFVRTLGRDWVQQLLNDSPGYWQWQRKRSPFAVHKEDAD